MHTLGEKIGILSTVLVNVTPYIAHHILFNTCVAYTFENLKERGTVGPFKLVKSKTRRMQVCQQISLQLVGRACELDGDHSHIWVHKFFQYSFPDISFDEIKVFMDALQHNSNEYVEIISDSCTVGIREGKICYVHSCN